MRDRMRVWFLSIIIVLLTANGCGPAPQLYEPPIADRQPFTATEIPLQFDNGYPYLTIQIDSVDCEVYLDTGAAGVTIALLPDTIESLGLAETGGTRRLRTNYGEVSYKRRIAPALKLGGLTYRNVLCDLQDPDIPTEHRMRGIMGLALLRPFNVLIDYRAETLTLFAPDSLNNSPDLSSWHQVPLLNDKNGLHIGGTIPGADKQARLCLDTGAVASDQNNRYYNILRPEWLDLFGDVGEMGGMRLVESRTLAVGDIDLTGLHFIGFDFQEPIATDGFLGADFFMKYRVFVDFANELLYIQSYE